MVNRASKLDAIIIFFCGFILFIIGLRSQEIIGFESRFYLFALEMWRHGLSFFPTTYSMPYPDYPVTSTLLIYFISLMFGGLNKMTAVFPSALASALTLAFTYLLGALQSRRYGWYAAGFLLFTLAFITDARTISLDAYVTLVTVLCFYLIYSAELQQKRPSFTLIALMLFFGFAIRGPIGLVIPTGVMCVYYLLETDFRNLLRVAILGLIVLIVCGMVLLTIAYHTGGEHFMHEVLRMEVFGRLQEHQTPSHIFYFKESFGAYAVTYPLAILVIAGVAPQLLHLKLPQHLKFLQVLAGWILIIMIGLSIPADKKVRYILPIAPALALICAYLWMTTSQTNYFSALKKAFYYLCCMLPTLGLGVLLVLYYHGIILHYYITSAIFVVIQFVMLAVRKETIVFFLAVFSFVLSYIFIVEPINLNSNKTVQYVASIEKIREREQAKLVFYQEGQDGWVIKYLAAMPSEEQPLFISDLSKLPKTKAIVMASEEHFAALPAVTRRSLKVISHVTIGRESVVVFFSPG